MSGPQKDARRRNGLAVVRAMRHFDRPVTLCELARHIAETYKATPEKVMPSIELTIEAGVAMGFLIKYDALYAVNPDVQSSKSCPLPQPTVHQGSPNASTPERPASTPKRRILDVSDDSDASDDPKTPQSRKRLKK